jgi:hypothetical protein
MLLAACGATAPETPSTPTPATSGAPQMSDQQAPPQRLVIPVTIKGGQVMPTGEQLQAAPKETIVVRIGSDVQDELQVHSTPEHTFKVEATPSQSFQFSIDKPGKVDITLHRLNATIATVDVR